MQSIEVRRIKATLREHDVRCQALMLTSSCEKFLGQNRVTIAPQCRNRAEEITADQHPVCWVHARAAENQNRTVKLAYANVLDGSPLPELSK